MSKRKPGDRKDGRLLRNIDSMHIIMPILYPNRCDNEAFISETVDLTKTMAFIDAKNESAPEYKYKLFQVIVAAMLKTVTLRPKMNRFIANKYTYERNEVSAAFTVKKEFADNGGEALAFIHSTPDFTFEKVHQSIFEQVAACRSDKADPSTESMDIVSKFPLPLVKLFVNLMRVFDRHGKVPSSLIASDPYYASIVLTNLGSIKLHAGYHHLTNWGTNSVFIAIGERKVRPFFKDDGTYEMKDSLDVGFTIDERIADGYYYSKTVRLFKKLVENPELLELPFSQEVEY
ncbi:MAG: 2-oxo acid dehydrogenase subunit E2 [Oscillospiraceae bacterium]|nr:2-oxo acid dehydrogenase subunit E2 [Candidatus Equicaccousia limihippi]